jgi:hypothetical protein
MGDAADDLWESAFTCKMEFDDLCAAIRRDCTDGRRCVIVQSQDDIEDEDWLPYQCRTCGERFDFP